MHPGSTGPEDERVPPSVTLEFPGLRLTVRTPATAGTSADGGAAGGGASLLSDIPSVSTAGGAPGTAPGMFAGGAGGAGSVDPGALTASGSAATLLPARPETAPTCAADSHARVCPPPLPYSLVAVATLYA